jgi:hypothetical protein
MSKKKGPAKGDFAKGERTKPTPDEQPDFAQGVERVMQAILVADAPVHMAAAHQVVTAVERLPPDTLEGGAAPMLIFAEVVNETSIRRMSPFPLPIKDARQILDSTSDTAGRR